MIGNPTEAEVHSLTTEFVNSGYRGAEYANWPIERRLERFLHRRGMARHADNGDLCKVILERLMTHRHHGHGGSQAATV
ncbi:MAG: hypothetical protein WCE30_15605 [Mycobacterium sp.]